MLVSSPSLSRQGIKNPKYKDGTALEELPEGYQKLLSCFKAFIHMKIDGGNWIHKDWQNLTTKVDFQAFYIETIGFASYTLTQATTPTDVPTSVDTSANDLDDKGGVNETPPREPRLFISKVIDLEDNANEIDETPSEPSGRSSRVSTSSDDREDGDIDLDGDNGIDVLVADDSFHIFVSDTLDGDAFHDNRLFTSIVFDSEPPTLNSHLSTSVDNSVIDLNNDNGIDVLIADDPIRLFDLDDDRLIVPVGFHDDCGIKNALLDGSIPSEPPGLGCRLSTSIVIDLDDDDACLRLHASLLDSSLL